MCIPCIAFWLISYLFSFNLFNFRFCEFSVNNQNIHLYIQCFHLSIPPNPHDLQFQFAQAQNSYKINTKKKIKIIIQISKITYKPEFKYIQEKQKEIQVYSSILERSSTFKYFQGGYGPCEYWEINTIEIFFSFGEGIIFIRMSPFTLHLLKPLSNKNLSFCNDFYIHVCPKFIPLS